MNRTRAVRWRKAYVRIEILEEDRPSHAVTERPLLNRRSAIGRASQPL